LSAASRRRTVASSFFAWAADKSFFAPPGISSSKDMQLRAHARVVLAERAAPVEQNP
jgi:hypothetical protein